MSTDSIIAGEPIAFTVPLRSIRASWPVVKYSSCALSNGLCIRLAYVGVLFFKPPVRRTSGPSATVASFGIGMRGSGTSTATTALPSGIQSSAVDRTGSATRSLSLRPAPDFVSAT